MKAKLFIIVLILQLFSCTVTPPEEILPSQPTPSKFYNSSGKLLSTAIYDKNGDFINPDALNNMVVEDVIIIKSQSQTLKYTNGLLLNLDDSMYNGKIDKFAQKIIDALNNIAKSKEGAAMINELQYSENEFIIEKGHTNYFTAENSIKSFSNIPEIQAVIPSLKNSTGSGGTIVFNPHSTSSALNTAGNTNRPAYIGLAHELFHGRDANNGTLYPYTNYDTFKAEYNGLYKSEWRAVFYENIVRDALGIPLRTCYGITKDNEGNITPNDPYLLDNFGKPVNYTVK